MSSTFTHSESGTLLFDTIYIGENDKPAGALLSLRLIQGEAAIYEKNREKVVDYPGEYELSGYQIIALADTAKKLSYLISFGNKKVAFLQSSAILDDERVGGMDTRYIMHEKIKDQIEKRELEGEIVMVE